MESMSYGERVELARDILEDHPKSKSNLEDFLNHIDDEDDYNCPFSRDKYSIASDSTCKKYCEKIFPEIKQNNDKSDGPWCPCAFFNNFSYKEDGGRKLAIKFIKDVLNIEEELNEVEKNDKYKKFGTESFLADGRYGMDDSMVATKLLDKNFSPMIIRKYTRIGFPLYIHMICDANLDDLDIIVHDCIDFCRENGVLSNSIQSLRNFTGILSERINNHYDAKKRGCVESLGVIFYCDKMIISSLQGDCMNHESCRQELYDCLNLMTKI